MSNNSNLMTTSFQRRDYFSSDIYSLTRWEQLEIARTSTSGTNRAGTFRDCRVQGRLNVAATAAASCRLQTNKQVRRINKANAARNALLTSSHERSSNRGQLEWWFRQGLRLRNQLSGSCRRQNTTNECVRWSTRYELFSQSSLTKAWLTASTKLSGLSFINFLAWFGVVDQMRQLCDGDSCTTMKTVVKYELIKIIIQSEI